MNKAHDKGIRRGPGHEIRQSPRAAGARSAGEEAHLPWGRRNYILLAIGAGCLVAGFLLLGHGDTTIAPILLVAGYLGLIPWGIVASGRRNAGGTNRPDSA